MTEAELRARIGDAAFDALPDLPGRSRARAPQLRVRRQKYRTLARQRMVLSGSVPPAIGAGFTTAEIAVLTVLAAEHKAHGSCSLTIGEIAARAVTCRTVVQNALHWAERRDLVTIEHRRIARDRNLSNTIRIVSPLWLAWLRLGPSRPRPWGGGFTNASTVLLQRQVRGPSRGWLGQARRRNMVQPDQEE